MLKLSRVLCFSRGDMCVCDSCQSDFTSVINLVGLCLLEACVFPNDLYHGECLTAQIFMRVMGSGW